MRSRPSSNIRINKPGANFNSYTSLYNYKKNLKTIYQKALGSFVCLSVCLFSLPQLLVSKGNLFRELYQQGFLQLHLCATVKTSLAPNRMLVVTTTRMSVILPAKQLQVLDHASSLYTRFCSLELLPFVGFQILQLLIHLHHKIDISYPHMER